MSGPADPRLRLRLYIDGAVFDEVWIDVSHADAQLRMDAAQHRHLALTGQAADRGQRWMVEVYDPARPEAEAYMRFGTDPLGMVEPREVETLDVETLLGGDPCP